MSRRHSGLSSLRPARIAGYVCILLAAACASSHSGNPAPADLFTVVNDTGSTVTITECHGQIHDCQSRPAHLPPRGQLSSPLSSKSPAPPNLLAITGNGSETRCLVVPNKPDKVKVTQATVAECSAPTSTP
jgi:hypothetical protein